jgi:acyl-coenzyme A thioesterase PaaI-like protein
MELTVERKLAVTGRFQVTEAHQGAPGVAHGGILSAAFDEAMGAIAWYLLEPAVTVQLNVAYRAPVPVGSDVTVRAHLVHEEGRKLFVRGVAELADGHEVAEADGIFVKVPVSHFAAAVEPRAAEGDINTFSGEPQARA